MLQEWACISDEDWLDYMHCILYRIDPMFASAFTPNGLRFYRKTTPNRPREVQVTTTLTEPGTGELSGLFKAPAG